MDLQGDMAAGRSESSVTLNRASKNKRGLQRVERFSVRAPGGQTPQSADGGVDHIGLDGVCKGQGGVGSPYEVVPSYEGEAGPPNK